MPRQSNRGIELNESGEIFDSSGFAVANCFAHDEFSYCYDHVHHHMRVYKRFKAGVKPRKHKSIYDDMRSIQTSNLEAVELGINVGE